jgi:hypothetical protein
MKVLNMSQLGSWRDVANAARTTIGMGWKASGEPSDEWKRQMLLAEHSPIRLLMFKWTWVDLPSWVSVHFVRHKIGVEHFVMSQRSDRTGINRDNLPQSAPVQHTCCANAQALITISRKRMCRKASAETQQAWHEVIQAIKLVDPVTARACVPECVYRGFCPEFKSCGAYGHEFQKIREKYEGGATL